METDRRLKLVEKKTEKIYEYIMYMCIFNIHQSVKL